MSLFSTYSLSYWYDYFSLNFTVKCFSFCLLKGIRNRRFVLLLAKRLHVLLCPWECVWPCRQAVTQIPRMLQSWNCQKINGWRVSSWPGVCASCVFTGVCLCSCLFFYELRILLGYYVFVCVFVWVFFGVHLYLYMIVYVCILMCSFVFVNGFLFFVCECISVCSHVVFLSVRLWRKTL